MPTREVFDILADLISEFVPNCRKGEAATKAATTLEQKGVKFNRERFLTIAAQATITGEC